MHKVDQTKKIGIESNTQIAWKSGKKQEEEVTQKVTKLESGLSPVSEPDAAERSGSISVDEQPKVAVWKPETQKPSEQLLAETSMHRHAEDNRWGELRPEMERFETLVMWTFTQRDSFQTNETIVEER